MSFLQKYFLRPQKQKSVENLQKRGKYKWIFLANKIVQVSSKRNVCIKFEDIIPFVSFHGLGYSRYPVN